jgi:hypothetical protein
VRPRNIVKRAPRTDVRRRATLVLSDGREVEVSVIDISSGGLRVKSEETLNIGEFVRLRSAQADDVAVQIRWSLGSEAGGVFLESIDYSTFA